MTSWIQNKVWFFILLLYFLLFTFYYFPFIENNMLPGRIDSWFNLGIFKHYSNLLDHYILNQPVYLANYPEGKVFLYGESSLATGVVFWIIDKLFNNDLSTYIGLYVFIQALNSFSFALFIKSLFKTDYVLAFVGGLFFSFSAFNLAFYDNVVYSIWFPIFFSLFYLNKAFTADSKIKYLILASFFFYLQLYFSVYNFFMGTILLSFFVLIFHASQLSFLKELLKYFILTLPLSIPFVYLYGYNSHIHASFNDYVTIEIIDSLGFRTKDIFRSFQSNLLYGKLSQFQNTVNDYWYMGNLGLLIIITSSFGFFIAKRKLKIYSLIILFLGVVLVFGPFWGSFKSPSFLLYEYIPAFKQFKLIFKFYYLIQIAIILLSINGLMYISKLLPSKKWLFYSLVSLIFLLENLPKNVLEFSVKFEQPTINKVVWQEMKDPNYCTLFMPMCAPMFPKEDNKECFVEGRAIEFKYLYWQAFLELNMLNGSNGTIPDNRMHVNDIFETKGSIEALKQLAHSHKLKYVYFDKKVPYTFKNPTLLELKSNFKSYSENEDYTIFTIQ
jgi:hypothetical protein